MTETNFNEKTPPANAVYALFDLDYTLIPHDTLLMLCNYILRRRRFRIYYAIIFLPFLPLLALKLMSARSLKRVFMSFLWGLSREQVEAQARDFVKQDVMPEIYPEVRAILDEHKKKGHYVLLTTASPDIYVKYIAEELGVDAYRATKVDIPERTPLFLNIPGRNNKSYAKIQSMAELLPESLRKLVRQDNARYESPGDDNLKLPGSYAYSDSPADFPILRMAEHATLIHPLSSELRREGMEKNWTILRPDRPYKKDSGRITASIKQALGIYRSSGT